MHVHKIMGSTKSFTHNGLVGDYDVAMINGHELLAVMKKRLEKGLKAANENLQRDPYEPKNCTISDGVIEGGIMPIWNIVIALSGDLAVDDDGIFMIPDTDEECEKYFSCVQIVDGHNRVLSTKEIIKALHCDVPVTLQIMSDPDSNLVGYHFNVMNTARKDVDKDLCFSIQYNLGIMKGNKREAYEHFVRACDDYTHPLYRRIKTDDKKGGFSIKTMVDYMVNDSIDVIEVLSKRYKSQNKRYEVIRRYWQVVELENAHDCTGGKIIGENGRPKRMTVQRAAVTNAELANFCQILFENEEKITFGSLKTLYNMWIHDIMRSDHILLSDNGTIVYKNNEGEKLARITDRWNGRHRALTAVQTDYEMLTMAFKNQLMAERV